MSLEPFKLTPYEPPAGREPARLGKPDEDAWNRYAAAALAVEDRCRSAARAGRTKEYRRRARARGATEAGAYGAAVVDTHDDQALEDGIRALPLRELQLRAELVGTMLEEGAPDADHRPRVPGYSSAEVARLEVELEVMRAELALRAAAPPVGTPAASLILTSRKSTTRCRETRPVLFRCGCKSVIRHVGCEKVSCVRCAPRVTADRARRVYDKLVNSLEAQRRRTKAMDPRLWAVRVSVFTMPESCRDQYVSPAAWRRLRRRLWHLLRDEFQAAWACITTHPVGDTDPTIFHPHLNVLWTRKGLARGTLKPDELARLKDRWADLLHVPGPVDVWGEYRRHPACGTVDVKRLRHAARYYSRVFVGWHEWMPKAVQWYGAFVPAAEVEPVSCCDACGQPFKLEVMGDAAVQLYLHRLEIYGQAPAGPPQKTPSA